MRGSFTPLHPPFISRLLSLPVGLTNEYIYKIEAGTTAVSERLAESRGNFAFFASLNGSRACISSLCTDRDPFDWCVAYFKWRYGHSSRRSCRCFDWETDIILLLLSHCDLNH